MAMSDNTRGALLMAAAMAGFTANDGLMKAILEEVPLFQAIFIRSLGSLLAMVVVSRWLGGIRLHISAPDRRILLLRSMAEVVSVVLFLLALRSMPLPNITAILQVLPLAITLAAAIIFGEQIGWRRLTAILAGFAGVMLIVRPGGEGFGLPSLLALGSVCSVVVRDLSTRKLSTQVSSMTAACVMAACLSVFSGVMLIFTEWGPVSTLNLLRFAASILLVSSAYICLVNAMRLGEIGFVAPFRYTGLLWALLIGYVAFGFWPDPLSLLGAGIVVAAGVFTFYREMALKRREIPTAPGVEPVADAR